MLGSHLRLWREELALSQVYAARLLGIAASTLRGYEHGRDQPIPRPLAFACAAIKAKLMPYMATGEEQAEIARLLTEAKAIRRGPKPPGVEAERIAAVTALLDKGMTQAEAAVALGVSEPVVSRMLGRHNQRRERAGPWSEKETAAITEAYPAGGLERCEALLPGRSKLAIYMKAHKMGLTARRAAEEVVESDG